MAEPWARRWMPKIRYMQYDFGDLGNASDGFCPGNDAAESRASGMLTYDEAHRFCPWFQQWHARNHLRQGALDMGPNDLFIVAGEENRDSIGTSSECFTVC